MSSMDRWWVHVAGNQQTFTVAVLLTEKFIPEAQGAGCASVTIACYRTRGPLWQTQVMNGEGMTLEEAFLSLPFSSSHLTTPPFIFCLSNMSLFSVLACRKIPFTFRVPFLSLYRYHHCLFIHSNSHCFYCKSDEYHTYTLTQYLSK